MTLDAARINLKKAFAEGMGYVALSRVRSLDKIYLSGINKMALRTSEEAQQIDAYLRKKSEEAENNYKHLEVNFEKRSGENLAKIKSQAQKTKWAEKLAKMREEYPNAYKPWKAADDARLQDAIFENGRIDLELIMKMSKQLGRHQGSIEARIKKLFGEDSIL